MGKRFFRASTAAVLLGSLVSVALGAGVFQQTGSGMVGYWRLDDTATPARDSTVNLNDGAWMGGVNSLPGPANTPAALGAYSTACLNFNGSSGQVQVPSTPALTLTGDLTIALWIYKQSEAGDWVRLVGKGTGAVRTFGIWEESGGGMRILFQMYNGTNGSVLDVFSTGTIPLTAWTHVTCRMSGTAATIFINGAASGTGTKTGTPGSSTDPVTFGYAGFHTYWPGRMDDIRIYNVALSDATIAAIASGSTGPAAPTGLAAVPGDAQAALTWNASAGATVYNVKRSTTPGGPYTSVASNLSTTNYTDIGLTNGQIYYYVVSAVSYGEGPNSAEVSVTPMPPPLTATPSMGLQTNENATTATFNIGINRILTAGNSITFTVTSNDATEGLVSGGGQPMGAVITFTVNGPQVVGALIPITVTGVDDFVADPATAYTVTVSATSTQAVFNGLTIPNVQLTNNDNDTPGVTLTPTSGLFTSESAGIATFSVVLNSQPTGTVTMNLTSSNTAEGTVGPAALTFNTTAGGPNGWNTAHVVTVTGVDDAILDFAVAYTIVTGNLASSDPNYNGINPTDVGCANLDNEQIPEPEHVWGGGGGGCGWLGLEIALPLVLLRRRRRRT